MKWTALIGLLLLLGCHRNNPMRALSGPEDSDGRYYLVAGQSNAKADLQDPESFYSSTGQVQITEGGHLYTPTVNHKASEGITWLLAGDSLVLKYSQPYVFDNIAVGGSSISDWTANYKDNLTGKLGNVKVDAIIWVQGETDGMHGMAEDDYYSQLKNLILLSRTVQKNVPWYVAIDGMNSAAIRNAQHRIIAEGLAYEGPDVDDIRMTPANTIGADLTNAGMKAHAALWAQIL